MTFLCLSWVAEIEGHANAVKLNENLTKYLYSLS